MFFLLVTRHLSLVTVLLTCHSSLVPALCRAQIITTVAGNGRVFRGEGGPGTSAALGLTGGVAVDSDGNVFATDINNNIVVKINPNGVITVVAGNNIAGFSGDEGPATSASLNFNSNLEIAGLAVDAAGNLYIADSANQRVRKVSPEGVISTVAGNGRQGFSGDGGPATSAALSNPLGLALDNAGNLYIADRSNRRIRKVRPDGMISTVAGNGTSGFSGDGGPATSASLGALRGIAVDIAGNFYIADFDNQLVRKVSPGGIITTLAGNGVRGFSGDGGPATHASLSVPRGVAADEIGNLYIADGGNQRIRKVSPDGIISTVAGGSVGFSGDDGPAVGAAFNNPYSVVVAFGNLYIADSNNGRVRKVGTDGIVTTIAGIGLTNFSGDGGPATIASLSQPQYLAVDGAGTLFIADQFNHRVRKVGATGTIATAAGNGTAGFSGDGGLATSARLNFPRGVAVDAAGNLYIADSFNARIRKLDFLGNITTVAGGRSGFSGDGGLATAAALSFPHDVALDQVGNLYIADRSNNRVRKVDLAGVITTVAGSGPVGNTLGNFSGDGGPATNALLAIPEGIGLDAAGNLYIADKGNNRIRKVTPDGIISTVAGGGSLSSERIPATSANLGSASKVTVDLAGNLLIASGGSHQIRKVSPDGIITTVAGNGISGFSGDGGPATSASLSSPQGVAVDRAGNLYIADTGNDRVRIVLATPPSFSAALASLNFTAQAGSGEIAPQQITVTSPVIGLAWSGQVTTQSGGNWLSISPAAGSMPSVVDVNVNVANLAPGTYQGTVTIQAPLALPTIQTIAVRLTVGAASTAKLAVEQAALTFETLAGGNPPVRTLRIGNAGGGSLNWAARVETTSGGNWLSLSPASGSVTAGASNQAQVAANSSTLAAGVYSGTVVVESATTSETLRVPVSLLISQSRQTILVSQSGLLFTGVEGGSLVPPQSFGVLNTGEGVMSWTAQASTLAGGNWLSVSPTNVSTDAAALRVPLVNVAVNVAGLAAGQYSGLIRVSAATANNSPQFVTVELNVLPRGSNPGVLVRPTGLIFAAQAGTSSPGSQLVSLAAVTPGNVDAVSGLLTRDGASWLEAVPRNLTLSAGDAIQRIVVQPTLGSLAPGVYRGALTLLFSDSSPAQVVNILFLVVSGRAGTAGIRESGLGVREFGIGNADSGTPNPEPRIANLDSSCAATQLHATHRTLGINFASPVGWPSTVEAQVADDCGNAVPNATVVARFSNGDPLTVLTSLRNGLYVGTWRPVNSAGQVTVTVRAELPPLAPVEVQAQGQVSANAAVPALSAGGVVNAASFAKGEAVAPGSMVSIFGAKLAVGEGAATRLPLENQLAGTAVTIGGQPMPLLYANEGQVNAVVPYGLALNTRQQIVVRRGNSYSVPEPVTVAAAQPAVFTKDLTGKGQALIFVATSGGQRLADASSPARAGDAVVIYCSGLGAVNPPVAAGAAAPSSPLSTTANPVSVTIGGREAQVLFAGLAPGFAGLYQVNAIVPPGIAASNDTPVSLTVAGQTSPPVTFAVR